VIEGTAGGPFCLLPRRAGLPRRSTSVGPSCTDETLSAILVVTG
jgi:hypothetical protein